MVRLTTVCTRLTMGVLSIVAVLANEALDPGPFSKREPGDRPSGPDVRALEPGQPVERQLTRGEEHRYQLALATGEYAGVTVDQQGIDITVQLRGIDNSAIADFDDEVRRLGREQVGVVADKEGTYTLAITAARGTLVPGAYAIRIVARRAATEGDREKQESRRLQTTGARLEIEGSFEDSRRSLERALAITEAVSGPDDVQAAVIAAQLAGVYRKLAEVPEAESLYRRAIAILERTLGAQHPRTAFAQSQLAALYQRQGERRKAEALLEQAVAVIRHTLGEQHPWFVSCLATQGNLLDHAGDLDEEETVVQRALSIMEHSDDTNSLQYAGLLNNLGEVYRQKQDYLRAESLFQRSLGLSEQLLGRSSYAIATVLQNLGIIARERKDYATAVAYNTRALSID